MSQELAALQRTFGLGGAVLHLPAVHQQAAPHSRGRYLGERRPTHTLLARDRCWKARASL